MIATSTKTTNEFIMNFWGIKFPPEISNYITAWETIYMYIFNSFKITLFVVVGVTILSGFSGYAFAKLRFKGKDSLYVSILAFKMIPTTLILIPMFINVFCAAGGRKQDKV